jgi:hypothetical protein
MLCNDEVRRRAEKNDAIIRSHWGRMAQRAPAPGAVKTSQKSADGAVVGDKAEK